MRNTLESWLIPFFFFFLILQDQQQEIHPEPFRPAYRHSTRGTNLSTVYRLSIINTACFKNWIESNCMDHICVGRQRIWELTASGWMELNVWQHEPSQTEDSPPWVMLNWQIDFQYNSSFSPPEECLILIYVGHSPLQKQHTTTTLKRRRWMLDRDEEGLQIPH